MNEYENQHLFVLNRIAIALETLAMSNAPAPAFVKPMSEYKSFDWNSIGASVTEADQYGVSVVEWGGYTWKRRSPSNNFAEAIYFSRPIGKKQDGSNNYARLITFKDMGKVKPISREAEAAVQSAPSKPIVSRSPEPDRVPNGQQPEAPSELDQHFGTQKITARAEPVAQPELVETWPATEAEFNTWAKARGYNGAATRAAFGTDAKSWMRSNPGKGWADVAKSIAGTLGK